MNYGYFDLENKEYVITKPDTPARLNTALLSQTTPQDTVLLNQALTDV